MSGKHRRGFTLIELLVVMAIIATLLSVVVPRYFHTLQHSREAVLKHDLGVLREAIDKYRGDVGKYPESLDDLVQHRYIRAVPEDPITRSATTWQPVASEDPDDPGLRDVFSGAEGAASDGTTYRDW
ncbi:MAG: hypothetical protein RLZZ393_1908 [Pseudomonadota bacterium]|jgi:general secretion pathway protein G